MPEVSQLTFSYVEVAEALVKQAKLHEGRWQVVLQFGLAAANMGPTPQDVVPCAAVAVQSIGLIKAQPESPEALVVDAAIVNPASTG